MAETGHIEPEAPGSDADSGLGEDAASSTASVASSVLNYQYENGRRYHGFRQGTYLLPNDEAEQDRLDFTHHILSLLLDGELYRAPLEDPHTILDVGTGTGIWAIDIADKFPSARVIATDLSPIQPEYVPPNLEFQVDDCESEWTFGQHFDFVHMRILSGSIADWPKLMRSAYESLKPGGYLEVVDWETETKTDDGSLPSDSNLQKWQDDVNGAASQFGRDMKTALKLKGWVTDAGFADVEEEVSKAPINAWPKDKRLKDVGRAMAALLDDSLEAYSLALYTRVLGWSQEELTVFLAKVRQDVKNKDHHIFTKLFRVWAKKPGTVDTSV